METITGVYKEDGPYTTYISTNAVKALYNVTIGEPLTLGANVSLSRAIEVFQHVANAYPNYRYLDALVRHWKLVANVSVRNVSVLFYIVICLFICSINLLVCAFVYI